MNDHPNAQSNLTQEQITTQPDIEIFDPPLCCPTGVCGPTVDQTLLDVNEMVVSLQNAGHRVERYQMTTSPQAFINNPEVMRLVREKQLAALPLVLVHGKVISVGSYPGLADVQKSLDGGN